MESLRHLPLEHCLPKHFLRRLCGVRTSSASDASTGNGIGEPRSSQPQSIVTVKLEPVYHVAVDSYGVMDTICEARGPTFRWASAADTGVENAVDGETAATTANDGLGRRGVPIASQAAATASLSTAFKKSKTSGPSQITAGSQMVVVDECSSQNTAIASNAKVCHVASKDQQNVHFNTSACTIPANMIKTELNDGMNDTFMFTSDYPVQTTQIRSHPMTTTEITATPEQHGADAAQMDIYRDLILRHLIQDISTTCAKLSLPTDPYHWSAEHSARWISEMCVQFSLPPPRALFLAGRVLLDMTADDFLNMAPEGGDTLHAQLQLWKTAFESYEGGGAQPLHAGGLPMNTSQTEAKSNGWYEPNSPDCLQLADRRGSQEEKVVGMTRQHDYMHFNNPNQDMGNGMYYNSGAYQNMATPTTANQANNFYPPNGVLPSPTNSEMSSNDSSMPDMVDDDCLDMQLNMMKMQRGQALGGFPGDDLAANMMPMEPMTPGSSGTPAPFPRHSGTVHLWHFIRELLDHPKQYGSCVRWVDREEGTFKIESSHHLARFWGQRKNRAQMNYDKLSRSLRQYYKKGIIQKPEKKQRLVYKFLPPYNL